MVTSTWSVKNNARFPKNHNFGPCSFLWNGMKIYSQPTVKSKEETYEHEHKQNTKPYKYHNMQNNVAPKLKHAMGRTRGTHFK